MLYLSYDAVHSVAMTVAVAGFAVLAGTAVAAIWAYFLLRGDTRQGKVLTGLIMLAIVGFFAGGSALLADHAKLVGEAADLQHWSGVNRGVILTDDEAGKLLTDHVGSGSLVGGAQVRVQIHTTQQGAVALTYTR